MSDDDLAELVEIGDLDELIRATDRMCDAREWARLVELRDRCRRAVERGKQLWPAANHVEYRLALEAPGEYAARMLTDVAGLFGLGPLAEVAAARHAWAELAPYVPGTPTAAMCAHERVLRGEDLRAVELGGPDPLEVPRVLCDWEPRYPLAEYRSGDAAFPSPPPVGAGTATEVGAGAERIPHSGVARTLRDLVHPWTADGDATTAAVRGDVRAAIGVLDGPEVRLVEIDVADALAWLGWAGASGGAHGRRRGAAAGRLDAWMVLAELVELGDVWPLDPDELGARSRQPPLVRVGRGGYRPHGLGAAPRGGGSRTRGRVRAHGPRPGLTHDGGPAVPVPGRPPGTGLRSRTDVTTVMSAATARGDHMPAQTIEYPFDGTTHIGHLAVPDSGGTGPAVLLAHEGPGLDDHVRGRADRLAALGYTAFALDYHGGPMEIGAAFERVGVLAGDEGADAALGQAGLDVLLAQPGVDAARVAAMGYCFGGALVLALARTGVPLAAVIGFHASLPAGTVESNRRIAGRVLMCMGTEDPIVERRRPACVRGGDDRGRDGAVGDGALRRRGAHVHQPGGRPPRDAGHRVRRLRRRAFVAFRARRPRGDDRAALSRIL